MERNPGSPWNPLKSCNVSPEEFEKQVTDWIRNCPSIVTFSIKRLLHFQGNGGDYEIDVVAEFEIFNGAKVIIIIECKRHNRPLERDVILSLHSKLQDVGAQKAIIFSTSGFQKGALSFAKSKGIACVTFLDGEAMYETKSMEGNHRPPSWIKFPKYSAIFLEKNENYINSALLNYEYLDSLENWLLAS